MTGNFADFGIDVPFGARGPEVSTTCARCSSGRKPGNQAKRCLSVNVEKGTWNCHNCGWTGGLGSKSSSWSPAPRQKPAYRKPDPRPSLSLPENARAWFHARGITDEVLVRNRVDFGQVPFAKGSPPEEAAIFPYFRNGELVNRKYRAIREKKFRMEAGCELALYGLDDIERGKPLIWVEGEPDKLALEVAGYRNVVSVPNGASTKLSFIEADRELIDAASHHVLAVDSDEAGRGLAAELCRRLGPEKCSRVLWPEGCKDANEALGRYGADETRDLVEHAEPYPIEGAISIDEREPSVLELYDRGLDRGVSTGWRSVDGLYRVRPGELTVVTGIPSSGKSNWLDCLLVNIAREHGWHFAIFSPENLPVDHHMAAIAEKIAGSPFFQGPTPRMTRDELAAALAWAREHFTWIQPPSEDDWTIEKVLAIAGALCLKVGIRGLVVDPWNELEALRPAAMTETEYVSHVLKRVRVFARARGIHVWLVVHPQKLRRGENGKYPVPTLYDCSGSAHFRNKADNGLVVWRDLSGADRDEVSIYVQKVRFRATGQRGVAKLLYERGCATYREPPQTWVEERHA